MWCPTISIYKPNSNSASFGRFLEGDKLRVCYDTETEFLAGLARVKIETLFGSDWVSRVRSGYDSGNRVKAFSLSGAIGLVGLSSGRTKTSPQTGFSLIPQLELG
jgi:hypothetical protein